MVFDFFGSVFKRKVVVLLYEKGKGWEKINTNIIYDRDDKKWYLHVKKDKIPCPENVFDLLVFNCLIVLRVSPNEYRFVNLKALSEAEKPEIYRVPPDELYEAIKRAELRRERMKGFWEKYMPIIFMVIGIIGMGIFIAVVWSGTGNSLVEISKNFDHAMQVLQNITQTQNELIKSISQGGELLPR